MPTTILSETEILSLSLEAKKEIIGRFNERADAALAKSPPNRDWVKKALTHGGAPRCPVRLRRLSMDIILPYGDALADLFCEYPDDVAYTQAYDLFTGYQPIDAPNRLDLIKILTENARWTDEWGTEWGHAEGGVGASTVSNPLQEWSQLDDYLAHRMPDSNAPGRLDGAMPAIRLCGGHRFIYGAIHQTLFERFHALRGMDKTFTDFPLYPNESARLLDTLTDYMVELVRRWGKLEGVEGILMTDDWGTQLSPMISPAMWRKFFAANYRRIFDEIHRAGKLVMFHSCGNILPLIGDLIDVGVDILDPIQPEAMDIAEVAKRFGGKVTFCGGISDQQIARMTPQQVKDNVQRTIDVLGAPFGNAYLVAPSNSLTPEIPFENLQALFEAAYGK